MKFSTGARVSGVLKQKSRKVLYAQKCTKMTIAMTNSLFSDMSPYNIKKDIHYVQC